MPSAASSRILREERGSVTLVELVTAMVAGLVILAAVLALVVIALKKNTRVTDRVGSTGEVNLAFDRVKDDIREAYEVTSPAPGSSSGVLEVKVPTVLTAGGVAVHSIRWDCTQPSTAVPGTYRCTRNDLTGGGIASGEQETIDGVVSAPGGTFTVRASSSSTDARLPTVEVNMSKQVRETNVPVAMRSTVSPRQCPVGTSSGTCPWP